VGKANYGFVGPEHASVYRYGVCAAARRLGAMPWIGKVFLGWVISEKELTYQENWLII
jgi:hypothetical protein